MRWFILSFLAVGGISSFAVLNKMVPLNTRVKVKYTKPKPKEDKRLAKAKNIDPRRMDDERREELKRLNNFGNSLEAYARANNYNTRHAFLVDMKLPSGRNRFFIYDMKCDSVLAAGLVAHGSGRSYSEDIEFSNQPNSYCTSLGRYKVGNSYTGSFGLAFKLYGLDATNSNAYARAVVLHGHSCVPNYETAPYEICQSWGCPTVSPTFLKKLKNYLDNSDKPMLLWVVN